MHITPSSSPTCTSWYLLSLPAGTWLSTFRGSVDDPFVSSVSLDASGQNLFVQVR
jgi:hypothetical protein